MTEEQIKQKAEAEADKVIIGSGMDRASVIHLKHLLTTFYVQGYHTGAEPREKQIQIDAEHIRALQKQNGELTDKVKKLEEEIADLQLGISIRNEDMEKLEAQIEKMKCCGNCKNYNNFHRHCEFDAKHSVECHCNNYKLWEIKEK